jgi:hypothetical protein
MRPTRYHALPDAAQKEPEPASGNAGITPTDKVSMQMSMLLSSLLNLDTQADIRKIWPYLPPRAQTAVDAVFTAQASSAGIGLSAQIRSAIDRHENTKTDAGALVKALTQTDVAANTDIREPMLQALSAMERFAGMQPMIEAFRSGNPQAFLSKQMEQQSGNLLAPLLKSVMDRTGNDLLGTLMAGAVKPFSPQQ